VVDCRSWTETTKDEELTCKEKSESKLRVLILIIIIMVKVKVALVQSMKAQRGSRGIVLVFLQP
jgi:hypothetical protein